MVGFTTVLQAACAIALALLVQMPCSLVQGMSLRRLETMKYEAAMSHPSPSCFIENGFDYVGNDIGNAPGAVGECCYKCASVFNCRAWSWSNYNGGTCWFKSAQGEIIVNPAVKSARFFYGYVPYCTLDQNTDLVGNDIGNKPSAAAGGCCAICQNTAGCRAYTWTNQAGGTCWLKSKAGQRIYKVGVQSAQAYPVGYSSCPVPVHGIDYVNNDVGNKSSATPEGCCALCQGFPNCRAYSWSNHNGGTCWFKSAKRAIVAKAGVWSAQIYPNAAPGCSVEYNVDYVGNDISNAPGAVDSCCAQCEAVVNCQAWSWSDHNGGTCWLKSAKGAAVAKAGVKSAQLKYSWVV